MNLNSVMFDSTYINIVTQLVRHIIVLLNDIDSVHIFLIIWFKLLFVNSIVIDTIW